MIDRTMKVREIVRVLRGATELPSANDPQVTWRLEHYEASTIDQMYELARQCTLQLVRLARLNNTGH